MNTILAFSFTGNESRDAMLSSIEELAHQGLLELRDAVALRRGDDGAFEIEHLHEPAGHRAAGGGVLGTLAGLVALHPLMGTAAGTLLGAFSGAQREIGVDDAFVEALAQKLRLGRYALLVQVGDLKPEPCLERLRGLEGKLVHSNCPTERDSTSKEVRRGRHAATGRPAASKARRRSPGAGAITRGQASAQARP